MVKVKCETRTSYIWTCPKCCHQNEVPENQRTDICYHCNEEVKLVHCSKKCAITNVALCGKFGGCPEETK